MTALANFIALLVEYVSNTYLVPSSIDVQNFLRIGIKTPFWISGSMTFAMFVHLATRGNRLDKSYQLAFHFL